MSPPDLRKKVARNYIEGGQEEQCKELRLLKQWKENFIGPPLLPWRDEYDRPVGRY
jgi:hypothetical protein